MGNTFFFDWEVKLMEGIQSLFPDELIQFLKIMTEFGDILIAVAVLGILYWCVDSKVGRRAGLSTLMAMSTFPLIKNIVLRIRPYMTHSSIECLKPVSEGDLYSVKVQGYSFPSGHSAVSMSVYGSLFKAYKNKALRIICVLIILLVGLSRFTLGVHYPTDVLVGYLLGFISIVVMNILDEHFQPEQYYPFLWLFVAIGLFYCTTDDYFSSYGTLIGFTTGDLMTRRLGEFGKPKNFFYGILRLLGGVILFLLLSNLLKLPFSEEFLEAGTFLSNIYRTFRYAFSVFLCFGLYPQFFKWIEKKNKMKL